MEASVQDILNCDDRIRFVAKITVDGEFLESVSRPDMNLELSDEKKSKMARHVSVMASSHNMINSLLGKPEVTITLRGDNASLLLYSGNLLFSVSLDKSHEYENVTKKILSLINPV